MILALSFVKMKKRLYACILFLLFPFLLFGEEPDTMIVSCDTLSSIQDKPIRTRKNTIFRRIGKAFTKVFKGFNEIDTNYIEPQHYNYTVMLQNTHTYETYKLKSKFLSLQKLLSESHC